MPFVSVLFEGREISNVELTKESYVVGRNEECDIQIDNLGVSRQHAKLVKSETGYTLEDMGSVNGVFVNGEKAENHPLQEGDEILVGKHILRYSAKVREGRSSTVVSTLKMDEGTIRKRIKQLEDEKAKRKDG